jgi:hypothetical protein
MVENFFRAMAPVLFANLLTAFFVWACVSYSRLEAQGKERGLAGQIRLGAFLLVLFFLAYGLYCNGIGPDVSSIERTAGGLRH